MRTAVRQHDMSASADVSDASAVKPKQQQKNPSWQQFRTARWSAPPFRSLRRFVRLAAPAHISVLILAILVLIKPVEKAVGPQTFLVLVYLHLFFYPASPLGEHVENVVINLTLCAAGLAIAFTAVTGAVLVDSPDEATYSTPQAKAVAACVLIALCLVGGFFESYTPRLKTAMRAMLFSTTWTLTTGASRVSARIFTDQFYPAALAAAVSVVACIIAMPRTAHANCTELLTETLALERAVLEQSLTDFYAPNDARQASNRLERMRKDLLSKLSRLGLTYQSARFEVSFGRVPVVAARPVVLFARRSKVWLTCGMGLGVYKGPSPSDSLTTENDGSCKEWRSNDPTASDLSDAINRDVSSNMQPAPALVLGDSIANRKISNDTLRQHIESLAGELTISLTIVEACIQLSMSSCSPVRPRTRDPRWKLLYISELDQIQADESKLPPRVLLAQRKRLDGAINGFKESLSAVLKDISSDPSRYSGLPTPDDEGTGSEDIFRHEMYNTSFLMVTLFEVAKDTAETLHNCQLLLATWHGRKHPRILWPSTSLSGWLRSRNMSDNDVSDIFKEDQSSQERFEIELALRERRVKEKPTVARKAEAHLAGWTQRGSLVAWRVRASRALLTFKHSLHVRYAIKLALGVAALSLLAWLPGSRAWFTSERGVWLIVTYVWVLETSTGATFRIALYRAIGTIAGALYGIIAWYICGQGVRPAVALFLVLAEIPAAYFILFTKRAQNVGTVFALTQSIILLIPLVGSASADQASSVPLLGLYRGYQILIGNAAAVIVNLLIWPLHAREFLVRSIVGVTRQVSTIYLSLARQMLNKGVVVSPETARQFERLESKSQRDLIECDNFLDVMHSEVSLVPKPTETLRMFLDSLQRIRDLLVLLRRVRETALPVIRAEACFNVLDLRTELVSSVLLNLWVTGEALLTKSKMPQFLPSCRAALEGLTQAMREQIDVRRAESQSTPHSGQQTPLRSSSWEPQSAANVSSVLTSSKEAPLTPKRKKRKSPSQSGRATPVSRQEVAHHLLGLVDTHADTAHGTEERQSRSAVRRALDFTFFFVLAEHALLSEIIFEIEKLLILTKLLVGEQSFFEMSYLTHAEAGAMECKPRTRGAQKRNVLRQRDPYLGTLGGDETYWDSRAPHEALNSWMEGLGTSLPAPSASTKRGRSGPTMTSPLRSVFRPTSYLQRRDSVLVQPASTEPGSGPSYNNEDTAERVSDSGINSAALVARLENELKDAGMQSHVDETRGHG